MAQHSRLLTAATNLLNVAFAMFSTSNQNKKTQTESIFFKVLTQRGGLTKGNSNAKQLTELLK